MASFTAAGSSPSISHGEESKDEEEVVVEEEEAVLVVAADDILFINASMQDKSRIVARRLGVELLVPPSKRARCCCWPKITSTDHD